MERRNELLASLETKLAQSTQDLRLDANGRARWLGEQLENDLETWIADYPTLPIVDPSENDDLYLMLSVDLEVLGRELSQGDWSDEVGAAWQTFHTAVPAADEVETNATPYSIRESLKELRAAFETDLRIKAAKLREECLTYFRAAISAPATVPAWSEWWAENQPVAERGFSLVDYVRLKHRKLLGARQILQIAGELPKEYLPPSPLETGSCSTCGERTVQQPAGAGGSVLCPNCGVILVYHEPETGAKPEPPAE